MQYAGVKLNRANMNCITNNTIHITNGIAMLPNVTNNNMEYSTNVILLYCGTDNIINTIKINPHTIWNHTL